jgi:hypothetical protein
MTHGVGIRAWITNSQVVHAVAASPATAPYRFERREVVQLARRDAPSPLPPPARRPCLP